MSQKKLAIITWYICDKILHEHADGFYKFLHFITYSGFNHLKKMICNDKNLVTLSKSFGCRGKCKKQAKQIKKSVSNYFVLIFAFDCNQGHYYCTV